MFADFADRGLVIAHETGHAVVAWSSPFIPAPKKIQFYPAAQEAETLVEPVPEVISTLDALECAAFALGGAAGEAIALGGYGYLVAKDLDYACWAAQVARLMGMRRKRWRTTPFIRSLPKEVWRELHWFLDHAYTTAVARIETHRGAYARLRDLLTRGYADGRIEFGTDEIAACLGPKPV
jgi:hypothetical protein